MPTRFNRVMAETATTEPRELRAGLTWAWRRSLDDYPADTWTLKYWLVNATSHIEITAVADGTTHAVSVPASTTDDYVAGDYDWVATVESGDDKFQVCSGRIKVLPRIDQATALDLRSTARKILDQLEADYQTRSATGGGFVASYSVSDGTFSRAMQFKVEQDWIQAIEYWRNQVRMEEAAASLAKGLGNPRRFYARFT